MLAETILDHYLGQDGLRNSTQETKSDTKIIPPRWSNNVKSRIQPCKNAKNGYTERCKGQSSDSRCTERSQYVRGCSRGSVGMSFVTCIHRDILVRSYQVVFSAEN